MLDNQLIALFRPLLIAGLTARGVTDVTVKQAYEPTQQGVDTGPMVTFFKVSDRRYGFSSRKSVYDTDNNVMLHTTIQPYETTFQIEALATQDPADTVGLTASDIVNIAAGVMQSDAFRRGLAPQEVNLLRITDVRNPYFVDDRDRNEASPSFDVTFTHKQIIVEEEPVFDTISVGVYRV